MKAFRLAICLIATILFAAAPGCMAEEESPPTAPQDASSVPSAGGEDLDEVSQAACKTKNYDCSMAPPSGSGWTLTTLYSDFCRYTGTSSHTLTCKWVRYSGPPPYNATTYVVTTPDSSCPYCRKAGATYPPGTGDACAANNPANTVYTCGYASP